MEGSKSAGSSQTEQRQRFHKGRAQHTLMPGRTGLLITTTTGPVDRAKREIESLLDRFVEHFGVFSRKAVPADPSSEAETNHEPAPAKSLAALLAEELAGVRDRPASSARKRNRVDDGNLGASGEHGELDRPTLQGGTHPARRPKLGTGEHWRLLECHCKGYLFYQIDPEEAGDTPPSAAAEDSGSGEDPAMAADEPQHAARGADALFQINWNALRVAEGMFDQLVGSPEVVARFSYRVLPVVASCNPSERFIVPLVKQIGAKLDIPPGKSRLKVAVSIFVRNNTTVDAQRRALQQAVEHALPMTKFFVVDSSSADVLLTLAVVHSTCCIAVQQHPADRRDFNLHTISQSALQLSSLLGNGNDATVPPPPG